MVRIDERRAVTPIIEKARPREVRARSTTATTSRSNKSEAFPSSTATVRTKKSVRIRVSISRGISDGLTRPMATAAKASVADPVIRNRSKRRVRTTG